MQHNTKSLDHLDKMQTAPRTNERQLFGQPAKPG